MKTKEINFERVRVGKPESSCEPSVGSAGGMEFGCDVQTPRLGKRGQAVTWIHNEARQKGSGRYMDT
jgi:hypothetical protein